MSVTAVGHAETGRLWQSRPFWELVDKGVGAGGELLALHDAYRAAAVSADPANAPEETAIEAGTDHPETIMVKVSERTKRVRVTWADGAVTTVYPPLSGPAPTPLGTRAVSQRRPPADLSGY